MAPARVRVKLATVSKGYTGTSLGGIDKSPKRRKRDEAKRRHEEKRWAAKSGPVVSYVDPSRITPKPAGDESIS
jgi:hypothetical protein